MKNNPKDWRPYLNNTNVCLGCTETFTGKPKHDCSINKPSYTYMSQQTVDDLITLKPDN